MLVEVLKCKGNVLALRHSLDGKVEPAPVAVLRVGCRVVRYPQEVFVLLVALGNSRQVSSAKVATESDVDIPAFLERVTYALRVREALLVSFTRVSSVKVHRHFHCLMFVLFDLYIAIILLDFGLQFLTFGTLNFLGHGPALATLLQPLTVLSFLVCRLISSLQLSERFILRFIHIFVPPVLLRRLRVLLVAHVED